MRELERLGQAVHDQLGEPSPKWLRKQRRDLTVALGVQVPRRAWGNWWAAFALVAVLGATILMLAPRRHSALSVSADVTLSTSTSDRNVPLADGSTLLLAARTRARVKTDDRATRCTVEVGTVHFDVAPQREREFSVQAGAFAVTVVGTRFSVAREASGAVEVVVTHGVVRVNVPNRSTPAELRAGDRLRGDGRDVLVDHAAPSDVPAQPVISGQTTANPTQRPAATDDAPPQPDTPIKDRATASDDWVKLYRERDYAAALAAARRVGVDALLQNLAPQPLSELGDVARLGGDGDLALRAFETLGRRFPTSRQARDGLFLSGRVLASRGQLSAAQTRFEAYLAGNNRNIHAIEAMGRLVEIYAATKDPRAKTTARAYLQRAPQGPYQRLCQSVLAAP